MKSGVGTSIVAVSVWLSAGSKSCLRLLVNDVADNACISAGSLGKAMTCDCVTTVEGVLVARTIEVMKIPEKASNERMSR